jgi:hypothetical protein
MKPTPINLALRELALAAYTEARDGVIDGTPKTRAWWQRVEFRTLAALGKARRLAEKARKG